jgi:acetoin utilization deacetylase AcuC-like enzyme
MKINIDIKEDAQFRAHVKEVLSGQVRSILREELQGIVKAEIAKLRILQPESKTLSEMVDFHVQRHVKQLVSDSVAEARGAIVRETRDAVNPIVRQITANVKDHVIKAIQMA